MSLRRNSLIRRNDRCLCGSGRKFKACCSSSATQRRQVTRPRYIDTGAIPVRWLVINRTGTQFFADKDNRAIVFSSHDDAVAVAMLEDFQEQALGDINVAGVGEAKFALLKEKIPYVEVADLDEAVALVRERIEYGKAGELRSSAPTDLFQQPEEPNGDQDADQEEAPDQGAEDAAGDCAAE
jgi:hypothetical protein